MVWFFGNKNRDLVNNRPTIGQLELKRTALEKDFLHKVDFDKVDYFTLKGHRCWARVVSVYDGDTCTLIFFYNNRPVKFKCRLLGIDCAEKRTKDTEEAAHAQRALDRFHELVEDDLVYLECGNFGLYSRLLVTLWQYPNAISSINQILLTDKLAYPYFGRTKVPFQEWKPS